MADTYSEKLKDTRWQAVRHRILERDRNICMLCLSSAGQLEVHHLYYRSGKDPWDYPENALVTLCRDCHYEVGRRPEWNERLRLFMVEYCPIDDSTFKAQAEHNRRARAILGEHYSEKPGSFWNEGDDEETAL